MTLVPEYRVKQPLEAIRDGYNLVDKSHSIGNIDELLYLLHRV